MAIEKNVLFNKTDGGKAEWSLLPFKEMEGVIRVLTFGKNKYGANNWKKCDDVSRYRNAAMRHMVSYMEGENIDRESGESHLSHLICNALFLLWFDNKRNEKDGEELRKEYSLLNGRI